MSKGTVPETTRGSAAPSTTGSWGVPLGSIRVRSLSAPQPGLPASSTSSRCSPPAVLLGALSSGSVCGQSSVEWEEQPVLDLLLAKLLPGESLEPLSRTFCVHTHTTHILLCAWAITLFAERELPPALAADLPPASPRDSHFINGGGNGFLSRTAKIPCEMKFLFPLV